MSRAKILIIIACVLALVAGLNAPRPANRAGSSGPSADAAHGGATRQKLDVGFLPTTCHITCPMTDYASRTSQLTRFESRRFTDFPTVADAVKSGRPDDTFMVVPLTMKMREQGIPLMSVHLGHRDGPTVIVRKAAPAKSLPDPRGRTFSLPTRHSYQNIVIHKLTEQQGATPEEIGFVEVAPPDRVGYRMLAPTDEDPQEIRDTAPKAGLPAEHVSMSELLDARLVPREVKRAAIG